MEIMAHTQYRKWFLLGLLVMIIAAWYSVGYNHPDEHFQVLEFFNYKFRHSPYTDLPWEYAAHCRPALQPFGVWCLAGVLNAVGLYDPFFLAFLLRLFAGLFAWWVTCRMVILLLPGLATARGKQIFVCSAFLLWFVPYIGVRYSAENIAASCFFMALSLILQETEVTVKRRFIYLFVAGLFFGFSLFLRLQIGFAFIGLAVWILFIKKMKLRDMLILVLGGLAAIGIAVLIDHWFYGLWLFTPYNYFDVNIIKNVAAKFGVQPWWYYFIIFLQYGFTPLSICLIPLFFLGVGKKPWHVMSLVCITFLAGHFLIGHKEMRFLFPVSYAFIFLCSVGIDTLLQQPAIARSRVFNILFKVIAILNIGLLVFKIFLPSQEVIKYYSFIAEYAKTHNTTIVSFNRSPFRFDTIEVNFYKPQKIDVIVLHDPDSLTAVLRNNPGKSFIYLSHTLKPGAELAHCRIEKLYCFFPEWLLHIHFNNWQDRSNIWAVYRLYPE